MNLSIKPHKIIIIAISLFLMFGYRIIPSVMGLNNVGMATLCIFIATMLLLLTVDLTWPVFLCIIAFACSGVFTAEEALRASVGTASFWFVVLGGMVISVLNESDIIKRIAIWFICRPIARKSPWLFMGLFYIAIVLIGSIIDPIALIIIMAAFAEKILTTIGYKKGDRFGELMMIGVLACVGLSYGMTPIGHAVPVTVLNMFANQLAGSVSFLQYCIPGYTFGIMFVVIMLLVMKFVFRFDLKSLRNFDISKMDLNLKPMGKRGKASIIIYMIVILMWLFPGFIQNALPSVYALMNGSLGAVSPLIIGTVAMCIIPVEGRPLMVFSDKIKDDVPWNASFVAAAAPLLGTAISSSDAGITAALCTYLAPVLNNMLPIVFVMIVCLLTTIMTNFCADMVTAMLMSTLTITLIKSGAIVGVNIGSLAICIGVCSGLAYATPPGAAYAAYVAGHGWVSRKKQLLDGGCFALICWLIFSTLGYGLGCLLL